MEKAVPVNKNSNAATMNAAVKYFSWNMKKNAYYPGVKEQVVEMAMNGASVRDTGRVLKIAKDTVSGVLKKQKISRNK